MRMLWPRRRLVGMAYLFDLVGLKAVRSWLRSVVGSLSISLRLVSRALPWSPRRASLSMVAA
jgi:hypothetical protein